MTSNVGARMITEKKVSFGFGENQDANKDVKELVLGELKNTFRPEFLNRVDDIIVFEKLQKSEIEEIAEKMLNNLSNRTKNLNIELEFEPSVKSELAEIGFDAVYGARPLRREIQNKIEDKLSEKLLDKTIKNGDKVLCSFKNDEFEFVVNN
jgi:ATP-dependent Clp protease ATP-binding subunit ClpC